MPKDEFDPEDPMELCGVGLITAEDTSEAMTDCFIEEFMRLGYNHKQLLALFRNPHYVGVNMVLQNRGEQFVRDRIADQFAARGRNVEWNAPAASQPQSSPPPQAPTNGERVFTDPMGNVIPSEILNALTVPPPERKSSCDSGPGPRSGTSEKSKHL